MGLSQQITNAVWGRSGGRCYLDRTEELTRSKSGNLPIGEVAHIVGERPSGPRGDAVLPTEDRNKIENLLLLCPSHHAEIDKHPDIWTVERLTRIKKDHEDWVKLSLDDRTTPFRYFSDTSPGIAIDLEKGDVTNKGEPRFSFSLRNAWTHQLVVHSIDAEVLSLGVRPSTRHEEHLNACSSLTMRTPVTFDFSSASEGASIAPSTGDQDFQRRLRKMWTYDPYEVAIFLDPSEIECFSATLSTGSFAMGTFRLVATYWSRPDFHFKAYSPSIGFFSVPDNGFWTHWDKKRSTDKSEASVVGFDTLVKEAVDVSPTQRPIWSDEVFDRKQLFQRTLGCLSHGKSQAVIEEWLTSDKPELHLAALEGIDAARNSEWKSAMAERALSSPFETVRSNAISIVGDLEYTEVFETLARKVLSDSSPLVRRRALERLRHKSTPELDRLKNKLKNDTDPGVRELANHLGNASRPPN